jgi:hypothetical protein
VAHPVATRLVFLGFSLPIFVTGNLGGVLPYPALKLGVAQYPRHPVGLRTAAVRQMPIYNTKKGKRVKRGSRNYATRQITTRFHTESLTTVAPTISNTWTSYEPTYWIRLGTDYNGRLGREVTVSSIELRGMLVGGQNNLVTDDSRNIVRIVMAVVDASFGPSSLSPVSLNTPITNINVTGLIRVLADRTFNLRVYSADSTGYVPSQVAVSMKASVNSLFRYNDSIGGFSPVPEIYVMFLSDSSLPSNPGFVSGYLKTNFRCTCG